MSQKTRIARVTAATAVTALVTSMAIGAAPNAGAADRGAADRGVPRRAAPAVPTYYMALPGGDNFANAPGAPTAVVGNTLTGKRLLTVRPSGKDKFVTVSAAADDRTFVLGAAPNLSPPAIPTATDWYLVHLTTQPRLHATIRKLHTPALAKNDLADATALSPDGTQVAVVGLNDAFPKPPVEWLRVYSARTGALLRTWTGPLNVNWDGYTTLAWTAHGHQLAIGYTFSTTRPGSKRIWDHLGVRAIDVRRPGHDLIADSNLVWQRLTRGEGFSSPVALNCALDIRVVVSADGAVTCAASGLLRVYNPNPLGAACPKVPPWQSLGFLSFSAATGKQSTLFQVDTNCVASGDDVLWTSASGDAVIGYYMLGEIPVPGDHPVVRFGVFGAGKYTPLPVPPTTASVPNTIAW